MGGTAYSLMLCEGFHLAMHVVEVELFLFVKDDLIT